MHYKTVWLSDIHLGTKSSQAEKLLDFLKNNDFDKLYLVGDIIDMISLKKTVFWNNKHTDVIRKLLKLAKKKEIVYIIGNHDYFLEIFENENFGNIEIKERDVHTTASGQKMLVLHGHQFDGIMKKMTWLYFLGDKAYSFALWLNYFLNKIRKVFGMSYWSLSLYLKTKVKDVIKFANEYEKIVVKEADKSNADGVICGHIHVSADSMIDGKRYLNIGCWTEYCSCVVEDMDGNLSVIEV